MKRKKIISLLMAIAMIISVFSFGSATVGASSESSPYEIDYVREVLYIDLKKPESGTAEEDEPWLMYAVNLKGKEAKDLEKAKWFPTYTGIISISNYIPTKANKTYYIAIKVSNQENKDAVVFEIKQRQPIGKNDVVYNMEKQQLETAATGSFEVKINDDVYDDAAIWGKILDNENPFPLPVKFLPTGGTASVRIAPVEEAGKEAFASEIIKIKLPKLSKPAKPVSASKVTLLPEGDKKVSKGYIKGVNQKIEVLVGVDEDTNEVWETLEKNITAENFDKLFSSTKHNGAGKDDTTVSGKYSFKVRVKATNKKAESEVTVLEFTAADYKKAAGIKD